MLQSLLIFLGFCLVVSAKSVYYDWNITWVSAAPDGFVRPVIGINNQWPCPQLDADVGDRLVITIHNGLGNQSTGIHWHGIHQRGSSQMDGASGVTQCPVAPGLSFTYDFIVDQPGTYWYHSHNMGQFPDGLWGPMIVHDPNPPFHYDEEIVLTLSDWYHEEMPYLINAYQSQAGEAADGTPNPSGGALMNSGKDVKIYVKPNKVYFIRIICPANYVGHVWSFDQHPMTTVEVDAVYVEPTQVNANEKQARVAPGQRQGVLITTKNDTSQNYGIFDSMDVNMLFLNKGQLPPMDYNTNVTGWLVYNDSAPLPPPPVFHSLENPDFFDDLDYVPLDRQPVLEPVDHRIILDTNGANITGISRFVVNNLTYLGQNVPSLYTALTVGDNYSSNPLVYGQVNPYILQHNSIVELVINNLNSNLHPWHLHGHQFQVLQRPNPNGGSWTGVTNHSATPLRRDTIMVQPRSHAVIRFRADNPGVWSLHCHIEFHVLSGFIATFVEAPDLLAAAGTSVPHDHLAACAAYPMPARGNAAGNVYDPLDLTGAVTGIPLPDEGATYPPPSQSVAGKKLKPKRAPVLPASNQEQQQRRDKRLSPRSSRPYSPATYDAPA